jgi:hypothetical protein
MAMHEEIGFAPKVDSLEDVLRLKGNKEIGRFREQLMNWCEALSEGRDGALKRIKKDIRTANLELKNLKKWRKVDTWLFWAQIPTAFIPILSHIVTVSSFITHLWIERKENRHGWIAISR